MQDDSNLAARPTLPPSGSGLRILFTEGSSVSARQALYDLGPRHTIDVLDPSPLCQCRFSTYVRRWVRCPPFAADPCGYLRGLAHRLSAEKYDVLLPLHDEVFLLSRVREELSSRVAAAIAEFSAVAMLQSKRKFLELARNLNLACPETIVVSDTGELSGFHQFPVFLKLDVGTAGQTVRRVRDRRELDAALEDFRRNDWWEKGTPFLLQQPAVGEQGMVRGIFRHGQLVAAHTSRLSVRGVGGSAVARESVALPAVLDDFRRLGMHLNWHGALFGEFFFDPADMRPSYIEFNPRIGNSANAAHSGVNLMQHWVDVSLGRTPSADSFRPHVSTHSGMLILMSNALENASRRQLLAEIRRQRKREGLYEHSQDELTRPGEDWMSALPYLWVALRLLARPAAARSMVHGTVRNYALSSEAAQRIQDIPQERLTDCFR